MSAVEAIPQPKPDARERILATAYELFSRRAILDVGIDAVIDRAGVAKTTLYRHFPSKDDLVIAFLERREERWTVAWVEAEARRRGSTPEEQLLAIFELFDEWFHRDDFEACPFINVLLEMSPAHPLGQASVRHLSSIRSIVGRLAEEATLRDPSLLRALVAHSHEGVDRLRRRGGRRGGTASPIDGAAPDRAAQITVPRVEKGIGRRTTSLG
jgi:AcrR family transcriptional regulator